MHPVLTQRECSPLFVFRQSKHIQRVAVPRIMNVRQNRARHITRTAAAEACGDGDVLLAVNAERHGKTLHRSAKSNLPERFSGIDIHGAKRAVEITDERDASRSREHGGEEQRLLLECPDFFHLVHIVRGYSSNNAICAKYFVKKPL